MRTLPNRPLVCAALLAISTAGCASLSGSGGLLGKKGCDDGCVTATPCGTACDNDGCGPRGPKRWSDAWYAMNTGKPIGVGQKHKFGKAWPPFARPCETPEYTEMFHAAHYWPYPYVGQDRESVRQFFVVQQMNGWVHATTMYGYLFDPETQALTVAGRGHVAWILFDAAIHPEVIYVQQTHDPAVDQARLANVRATATELLGGATPPAVVLRHAATQGRPAEEVDRIRRLELENLPAPILQSENIDESDAT